MDAKAGLALLAVQKDDQSAAVEHYAYLQEQRGTMIETVSSVDRLLIGGVDVDRVQHAQKQFPALG